MNLEPSTHVQSGSSEAACCHFSMGVCMEGQVVWLSCPVRTVCLPACLLCSTTLAAGESGLEFLCLGGSLAFAFLAPEIEPGASCVPDKCSPTELSTISPESQC